jgi:NTE family protein
MADEHPVAFVLSSAARMVSIEIGMLAALAKHGVHPDLIVGASAGALIGGIFAAQPDVRGVSAVGRFWKNSFAAPGRAGALLLSLLPLVSAKARHKAQESLGDTLDRCLAVTDFEALPVHFECVAFDLKSGVERWFDSGPLKPPLLASAAAPRLAPPVTIGGSVYVDGGMVNPIPVDRAIRLGARTVYVLSVNDLRRPLHLHRTCWESALIETALRHRARKALADPPSGVKVHLLPTGQDRPAEGLALVRLAYGLNFEDPQRDGELRIQRAYRATTRYLQATV